MLELTSEDKPRAKEALAMGLTRWRSFRTCFMRRTAWAVLLIFQAMDVVGKDGAIKHVMSGVNPQGCQARVHRKLLENRLIWHQSAIERI
jgi:polyphosphate kinase 2 (PPK2 family)